MNKINLCLEKLNEDESKSVHDINSVYEDKSHIAESLRITKFKNIRFPGMLHLSVETYGIKQSLIGEPIVPSDGVYQSMLKDSVNEGLQFRENVTRKVRGTVKIANPSNRNESLDQEIHRLEGEIGDLQTKREKEYRSYELSVYDDMQQGNEIDSLNKLVDEAVKRSGGEIDNILDQIKICREENDKLCEITNPILTNDLAKTTTEVPPRQKQKPCPSGIAR